MVLKRLRVPTAFLIQLGETIRFDSLMFFFALYTLQMCILLGGLVYLFRSRFTAFGGAHSR